MKMTSKFLMFVLLASTFMACNKEDDAVKLVAVTNETATNIPAPQTGGQGQPVGGAFTKFSFETGEVTTSDTAWDIAFRGTTIAVNGGTATGTTDEPTRNGDAAVAVVSGTFASVTDADGLSFAQDANGSFAISRENETSWYSYNPETHIISPVPGSVLVVKTHDGKYAKVEIKSYYKDAPAQPNETSESRFYTFDFVYNPNEGQTSLN